MKKKDKLYTLPEARSLISEIRPKLQNLSSIWKKILPYSKQFEELKKNADRGGGTLGNLKHYYSYIVELNKIMSYLQKLNIEIKDISQGLIDFPSLKDGRVVYLCWKMDEETISHWHETQDGFAGRKEFEEDT
ncbi:MAG: DUF2203 domain-containing protein [Nitrospinota bacterium]|nr:DUF2203 domain-containing protein [Nitrospinota bacterium]